MKTMVDNTTFSVNSTNLTMRIQQAEIYLKEFENEVRRARISRLAACWASIREDNPSSIRKSVTPIAPGIGMQLAPMTTLDCIANSLGA